VCTGQNPFFQSVGAVDIFFFAGALFFYADQPDTQKKTQTSDRAREREKMEYSSENVRTQKQLSYLEDVLSKMESIRESITPTLIRLRQLRDESSASIIKLKQKISDLNKEVIEHDTEWILQTKRLASLDDLGQSSPQCIYHLDVRRKVVASITAIETRVKELSAEIAETSTKMREERNNWNRFSYSLNNYDQADFDAKIVKVKKMIEVRRRQQQPEEDSRTYPEEIDTYINMLSEPLKQECLEMFGRKKQKMSSPPPPVPAVSTVYVDKMSGYKPHKTFGFEDHVITIVYCCLKLTYTETILGDDAFWNDAPGDLLKRKNPTQLRNHWYGLVHRRFKRDGPAGLLEYVKRTYPREIEIMKQTVTFK